MRRIKEAFPKGKGFSEIFEQLMQQAIITLSEHDRYSLNGNIKPYISIIFEEINSMVYKPDYRVKRFENDPVLNMMYSFRSEILGS